MFDNRYLNHHDSIFVDAVIDDLTSFLQQANIDRVLLFPPVESRYRFLIHQTVEDFRNLTSFSVGEGNKRQTVVCLESSLQRTQKGQEMLMSSPQSREPLHRQKGHGRGRFGASSTPSPSRPGVQTESFGSEPLAEDIGGDTHGVKQPSPRPVGKGRARARKPEMQLYIPRGRRDREQTDSQYIAPVSGSSDTEHTSAQDVPDSWESLDMETTTTEPDVTHSENQWTQIVENRETESGQMKTKKGIRSEKNSIHKEDKGSGVPAASKRSRPRVQLYVPRGRRKMQQDEPHDKTESTVKAAFMCPADLDSQMQLPQVAPEQMDVSENNLGSYNKTAMGTTEAIGQHESPQVHAAAAIHQKTAANEGKGGVSVRSTSPCDDWYQDFELNDEDPAFHQAAVNVEQTQQNVRVDNNSIGGDVMNMSELCRLSDISSSASLGFVPSEGGGDTGPQNCPSLSEKVPEKCRRSESSMSELLTDTAFNGSSTDDHPINDELRSSMWESTAIGLFTHSALHNTGCTSALHQSIDTCADTFATVKSQLGVEREKSDHKNNVIQASIILEEPKQVNSTPPCTADICCESEKDGTYQVKAEAELDHISAKQPNDAPKDSSHSPQGGECEETFVASSSEYEESVSASCTEDRRASDGPGDAGETVSASTDNAEVVKNVPAIADETPEVVKNVPEMHDETPEIVKNIPEMVDETPEVVKIVPEMADESPEIVKNVPEMPDEIPEVVRNVPEMAGETPDVKNVPAMADETPEVVRNVPEMAGETSNVKNVPEMADETPEVVKNVPEMTDAVIDTATDSAEQAMTVHGKNDNAEEEDSWDNIYDDNGDCLDPSAMAELTAHVGEVKISKPKKINYLDYQPKEADMDMAAYSHVIEISDFPVEFQTPDILTAFKDYMSRGFDIKWVDDTHALGVFSSTIAAQDALKLAHPMMKLRPMSEASKQSRNKARKCQEFLQPYKARPETTAVAARRLVAGALGMTTRISKEQRDQERKQLKEAREKKRLDRKQKDDIWDGTFGKCAMDQDD